MSSVIELRNGMSFSKYHLGVYFLVIGDMVLMSNLQCND